MTTKEFQLNVCFNIKARVCNDSIGYVKEQDAIKQVRKWVENEIVLTPGFELDISDGYGEVEVYDIEPISVEVL